MAHILIAVPGRYDVRPRAVFLQLAQPSAGLSFRTSPIATLKAGRWRFTGEEILVTAITATNPAARRSIPTWLAGPHSGLLGGSISAVPEPSTWAMMLIGFAGLGFAFRQSRRKVSFA
jgi:hypothetical protein